MDREKYRRALFYFFIFVLGIIFGISLWATVNGDIGDKPSHYCPDYQYWWEEQCIPWWKWIALKTVSDPTALFNFFLMLFTAGLLISTVLLWRAGASQFKLMRQEFIATHRPRIIVRFIQGPFFNEDGFEAVWITFANVGETAATILKIGADLPRSSHSGNWMPPGIFASPKPIDPIVLASGQRHTLTVTRTVKDTPLDQVFPSGPLHCVGCVVYVDENGIERESAFYRRYEAISAQFIPSDNPEEEYTD